MVKTSSVRKLDSASLRIFFRALLRRGGERATKVELVKRASGKDPEGSTKPPKK
jgi:hypothetical protein